MRFKDCEMRPGKVLDVLDNYGTIKASCVGIFSEEDELEKMPPIYQAPFIKSSRHYFAAPHKDDSIWVIINWDNPQELFYCFRDDVNDNSSNLDSGHKDVEISMKRTDPDDRTKTIFQVTYDTDDGYKVENGGDKPSSINIDNSDDHNINLVHSNGDGVYIEKDGISLGSRGGSQYKAVCGEPLHDFLTKIVECLQSVAGVCSGNPYTSPIGIQLNTYIPQLRSLSQESKILSNKVTLDK